MPRKNATPVEINVKAVQTADEWLITSVIAVSNFASSTTTEPDPETGDKVVIPQTDGNIEVGDTLVKAGQDYASAEKFAVHYLVLLDGVVVDKGSVEVAANQLAILMSGNPAARNAIKATGYDALEQMGIAPASSTVS